jgi:hypothetical protein
MRLEIFVEGETAPVAQLPEAGATLVAFMSFAVVRGFGATHPLIALADRLHGACHVPLGPLTTFYDGTIEDAEDAEKVESAWQPAAALERSLIALLAALDADELCQALLRRADATALPAQAAALLDAVRPAARAGRRVRLEYRL